MHERKLKAVRRFLETELVLKAAQEAHDASQSNLDNEFRYSSGPITRAVVDGQLVQIVTSERLQRAVLQTYPIVGVFNVEGSGLDGRSTVDKDEDEA